MEVSVLLHTAQMLALSGLPSHCQRQSTCALIASCPVLYR